MRILFDDRSVVSRDVYDGLVARYDKLLDMYHALRIDKLANPARLPTDEQIRQVEERNEDLGMEIEQAIDDRAQGDPALVRSLWNDARRMLEGGAERGEVATRILRGSLNDD